MRARLYRRGTFARRFTLLTTLLSVPLALGVERTDLQPATGLLWHPGRRCVGKSGELLSAAEVVQRFPLLGLARISDYMLIYY
ncbi:hypothetical protein FOZ63_010909 [Perkinsus olseni]|uniref:Uncharacterized protein n=1 Tax=Perkinsus olseni TaxID=32597 RepID=A0A7J6TGJ1_PEROL|nr:hypothetical protein FOZ63_010909 [Perkinsus olseni]